MSSGWAGCYFDPASGTGTKDPSGSVMDTGTVTGSPGLLQDQTWNQGKWCCLKCQRESMVIKPWWQRDDVILDTGWRRYDVILQLWIRTSSGPVSLWLTTRGDSEAVASCLATGGDSGAIAYCCGSGVHASFSACWRSLTKCLPPKKMWHASLSLYTSRS